jgi:aryl-alcohol dehydrogenase-like predicted oxidoreductase
MMDLCMEKGVDFFGAAAAAAQRKKAAARSKRAPSKNAPRLQRTSKALLPPTTHQTKNQDAAELYPVPPKPETVNQTELIIGRWLKARGYATGAGRKKVILATKVCGAMPPPIPDRSFIAAARADPPSATPPPLMGLDAANVRAAIAASLRRLGVECIDLYQLHWPQRYAPLFGARQYRVEKEDEEEAAGGVKVSFDETVAVIGELIKEGKIKAWGLSNETAYGVCKFCEAAARLGVPPPASIQVCRPGSLLAGGAPSCLCCRAFYRFGLLT